MSHATTPADPYWSRQAGPWEAVDRADPVIWGDADNGPLTQADVADFESNGFRYVKSLFSPEENQTFLDEANRLTQAAKPGDTGVIIEPASREVRSVFRIHQTSELFAKVASDPRIVNVVRQILGSEVYIHQSRINFKPAFDGKEFFWHSDFETWHVEDGMPRMRAVSVSIGLTENNEFNGPLMVVPGSHKTFIRCPGATPENHFEQSLKKQEYGVPTREAMAMLVEQGGIVAPKGPAGSTLFFECNIMHGSAGNLSPLPRTNLFMVYNSVENAVTDPFGDRPARPTYLAERTFDPISAPPFKK